MTTSKYYLLSDFYGYDSNPTGTGDEKRFLCPECGESKPKDNAHRCLSVNENTGAYCCQRCDIGGKVKEKWTSQVKGKGSQFKRRSKPLPVLQPTPCAPVYEDTPAWKESCKLAIPLAGTPGAVYLKSRGIDIELAHQSGVRFLENWAPPQKGDKNPTPYSGGPAVMFPIREYFREDKKQKEPHLVAVQGRYIDDKVKPPSKTAGDKKYGVYATQGAWEADQLIIVEAPIDALSLAMCDFPAIALIGLGTPLWLKLACSFRRVLLGLDADERGDETSYKTTELIRPSSTLAERLRPPDGMKDWNECLLKKGVDELKAWLSEQIPKPRVLPEFKLLTFDIEPIDNNIASNIEIARFQPEASTPNSAKLVGKHPLDGRRDWRVTYSDVIDAARLGLLHGPVRVAPGIIIAEPCKKVLLALRDLQRIEQKPHFPPHSAQFAVVQNHLQALEAIRQAHQAKP
jgi:predicted RNA-binding Zn-ribbon protein involved in translation (DUF1610 family)